MFLMNQCKAGFSYLIPTMRNRVWFGFSLLILVGGMAFAPVKWVFTKKVLKVSRLELRDNLETTFIFTFHPLDSVKIRCLDCAKAVTEGDLQLRLNGGNGASTAIGRKKFETWLPIASPTGKFGLVFSPQKNLQISDLEIIRKSDSSRVRPGPDAVPLDAKNLFLNGSANGDVSSKTRFFFDLKRSDQITMEVKSVSSSPENLVCKWYREGESFDFDMAPFNQSFNMPSDAPFQGNYLFEYGVKETGKENVFNVRLERK